jgi:hypothetical protein
MTTKSGGLGSLPRGLDWISQNAPKPEVKIPSVQEKPIEAQQQPKVMAKPEEIVITAPKKQTKPTVSAGLPEGYTRATFIIKQEHVDRLKALSFVKKMPIKDLVDQAMVKLLKNNDVTSILMEAVRGFGGSESE